MTTLTPEGIQAYENKILHEWANNKTYQSCSIYDKGLKKYYVLVMFPYPSGKIHMGHVRNYAIGDVISRYKRLNHFAVVHPIGWDSFGLPAENAAHKHNIQPAIWTKQNIDHMRTQLKRLGISYNWDRELSTCEPEYYRYNQLFFLKMYEKGWAYKKEAPVNWCQECNTVLANEQVVHECCWRHETKKVEKKLLSQWFFKTTEFVEELNQHTEDMKKNWPNKVLSMQQHWVGKSEGAEIQFNIPGEGKLSIFTTRVDTIFGVTFLAIAPEHYLTERIGNIPGYQDIQNMKTQVGQMSNQDRENPTEKAGVFTGLYAIHPFTQEKIPIYVANFVLPGYGSGAVMGVPGHDLRDYAFAKKYDLDIKTVVAPTDDSNHLQLEDTSYIKEGILCNSGEYDDLTSEEARKKLIEFIEKNQIGSAKVTYKLRDWLVSRQRYWGTPIPIIYCKECGIVPLPEEQLPVILPTNVDFSKNSNPLKDKSAFFLHVKCPRCQKDATREVDTMDTFVDSSWYFLRYLTIDKSNEPIDLKAEQYYMPVDQYIGGVEHATMHLLYARYFTKVLHALGYVKHQEPFKCLLTQGMVLKDGAKMSKSLGNVVDPDILIQSYGADAVRLFTLFSAPPEKDLDWSQSGVEGCFRFIKRIYHFVQAKQKIYHLSFQDTISKDPIQSKPIALICSNTFETILHVTKDIETHSYNVAIAHIMKLFNSFNQEMSQLDNIRLDKSYLDVLSFCVTTFCILLNPFAPFISLELLNQLGMQEERKLQWPKVMPEFILNDTITIAIQINGKLRETININCNATKDEIIKNAKSQEKVLNYLNNVHIKKVIYVDSRLVNFVV